MKTSLLLTVASLATVLGTKPTTEEVKTDAAAGRYNRRGSYGGNGGGGGGYGGGYGYPSYGPGYWQPLVQDRFVCDLDASVLLVVDSHHHHHHNRHHHNTGYYNNPSVPANRAVRVKCAEVANHDEDSCNFCCQQTARRDTSLANDKLFGFLAITKTDDDKTFTRTKRGTDESPEDDDDDDHRHGKHHGRFHKVDPTYVVEADWKAPDYKSNVKCVCCAPRTNSAAQNPSTYNNAAASPPAASNPSTGYGSANTFNTQPVPANPVNTAAQQPWMDTWQQNDSGANWNTAASSGAATGANWNTGSSSNTAAAAASSTGANWNTAGASSSNTAPNTWSDAAPAAPAAPSTNWASNTAADTWGAASDAAAPAPPPAATQAPVVASNTY